MVIIKKVNTKGQQTVVWDKVVDNAALANYPSINSALKENVTIANVNEKKEHLVVDYTLTYNSNGNELQMHNATIVKDDNSSSVNISI